MTGLRQPRGGGAQFDDGGRRRRGREQPAIGADELDGSVSPDADFVAAVVDEPVVESAQEHQVAQLRLPAVGPVHDVVRIDEP